MRDRSCFLHASFQSIVLAQQKVDKILTSSQLLSFFEPWVPVVDNVAVRSQLHDTIHNISLPFKPLMIRTVTEEGFGFLQTPGVISFSPALYVESLRIGAHQHASKVLERYPPDCQGHVSQSIAVGWTNFGKTHDSNQPVLLSMN